MFPLRGGPGLFSGAFAFGFREGNLKSNNPIELIHFLASKASPFLFMEVSLGVSRPITYSIWKSNLYFLLVKPIWMKYPQLKR